MRGFQFSEVLKRVVKLIASGGMFVFFVQRHRQRLVSARTSYAHEEEEKTFLHLRLGCCNKRTFETNNCQTHSVQTGVDANVGTSLTVTI